MHYKVFKYMEKKVESFEWIDKKPTAPPGIKGGFIKIVAKTTNPTYHGETRIFLPEELQENSRSLIARSLSFNHGAEIENSIIVDSQYNEMEQQLECDAFVPESILKLVKNRTINHASIEFSWRSLETKSEGIVFHGLGIYGLSLLDVPAGDPGAIVTVFEDSTLKGRIDAVTEIKAESQEEPKKEEKKAEEPKVDLAKRITELETALKTAMEAHEETKKKVNESVAIARKEGMKEVLNEVESVLPDKWVENHFPVSGKRFTESIKNIILRKKKECA